MIPVSSSASLSRFATTAAEAWTFKHSSRKTDCDCALKLAQLEVLGLLPSVPMPAKPTRDWRALTPIGKRWLDTIPALGPRNTVEVAAPALHQWQGTDTSIKRD